MTGKTVTAGSDTDRQAIRDVLASLYKAWEAGDADAFVADYTVDATVVQPGVYKKDREEIHAARWPRRSPALLSGSRATDHPSSIRFLTGDTAIVISEGGIIFPGQDAVAGEGLIRATWVLVRRDGGLSIATSSPSPARGRCSGAPGASFRKPSRTRIRTVPGLQPRWQSGDRQSK